MTLAMQPWLPETALEQCSPEPLLRRAIQAWSDHWLVGAEPSIRALYQDDWPLCSASLKWRSTASSGVVFREPALVLASAMLGCSILPASLQPTDHQILDGLTKTAIDDLLRRVGDICDTKEQELSSSPIDPGVCGWWEISLAPGKPAFKLAISNSSLVHMIKRGLPAAVKLALEPVRTGLGEQSVRLAAQLGACSITLADLKELGIGDVLVLDRPTEAPIDVIVDGRSSPFRARLDEIDGCATLIVAPKEKSDV